ncbi:NAD(P)-binding oxidoreductase [uncultured Roseobacter sp.]|uniref:NAD(P)-dependent oxidoreductase n=1 Tax=uncultured Roseobacter sp. TaxID=114847 RepID=UPI002637386C|nr:NAD(P)-binding oxidoreductase [uncultured Roseobacter sp.]
MKVIVFGATGTVGRLTVQNLLAEGHSVTAFARTPDRLKLKAPQLRLVAGDATHPKDVCDAIAGHDAVVVTLGAGMSRRSLIRSQGTMNVIRGMQEHGVSRLICQSTLGAHESWSNLNFFWKRIMFGALLKPVFKDHELQEKLVQASGLDWTLVRPGAFTDGPATGAYKEGFGAQERDLTLKITRADVAGFLTRQLGDLAYLHRAVSLSD